ncbi:MAG: c-type cytochrome [Chloroflexi bacterium]|nr:c-type cytochrome [Chloroflexota bacterium]
MKLRHALFLATLAALLAACNFTLAQDVTPPPGYVPPTAAPTLGPLYPASAPDVSNGAAIYVEKCAACHGNTGLGDGEQGKQLPVKVAAIGLPDFAKTAKPSDWFIQVTNGNLDRFMPPFASLNDQERWDVVAYALTLHTTPEQLELGKNLFDANCSGDCINQFKNAEMMSALSEQDIVEMIKNGQGNLSPDITDDEATAVAMYIRSQTFASALPTPTTAPASETPISAEAGTPSAETTPVEGTQAAVTTEAAPAAGFGTVRGTVDNQTGAELPADVKVTLSGFEHSADTTTAPQEIVTLDGSLNPDGSFSFQNVEIPENRIYLAKVVVNGLSYQSDFAVVKAGMTELVLSPIVVFATTEDISALKIESLQMFFDFASEDVAQIFAVYSITNTGTKTVIVNMGDTQTVPFIGFPAGAEKLGYEASQDSAPFVPTDNGFAMPPSATPYGLIAFASVPKSKEIVISQPALLPIDGLTLFLPEGVEATGDALTDGGIQTIQTTNFHIYTAGGVEKDKSFEFTLKGEPKITAVNPDVTQNKSLLIGVGAFGLVLILAGVWMFMRDRKSADELDEEDESEDEFDDTESIMDAIIALDDLHRSGKLSDEAYQQRRAELKNALKKKS